MDIKNTSIVFFGTSEFSVGVLTALSENGITPSLIVTQPDRPKGRGMEIVFSAVKDWALKNDIAIMQPESLKGGEEVELLSNSEWDLFIVASYGLIIPQLALDIPTRGALNVHPSLLPKYRGASPVRTQILADDRAVGVSIMQMDEKMDHGPIVAQGTVELEEWPQKARILEGLLAHEGGALLAEVIPEWMNGSITPEAQNHDEATFCRKFTKEDGLLDLSADGYQNYLKFCANDGWPGSYFFIEKNGAPLRVKITDAQFADGELRVLTVVPEGKKEMRYEDFARGLSV